MSGKRSMQRGRLVLASLLALADGCVDDVVVGYQLPGSLDDALVPMPEDAQTPAPDASLLDAHVLDAMRPDAMLSDAAPSDAMLLDAAADANPCLNASCTPTSGPCKTCNITVRIVPDLCSTGDPQQCWYDSDGSCTEQCPNVASCRPGHREDCAQNEYCYFAREDCGAAGNGLCAPMPVTACSTLRNDACGCDGKTYFNWCVAAKAGTAVEGPVTAACN